MIDRYSISASASKIKDRFHAEMIDKFSPAYNAAPTHLLPVITQDSPQGISRFYWGTSPEWAKNKALSDKIINVAAETIPDKGTLRKALIKSRCLIVADGFYLWKKVGKKTSVPYRFVVTDQEVFSLAGFWEEFEDSEGDTIHTFRLITIPANSLVVSVQERMPVVMNPAFEKIWLSKDSTELQLLNVLKPYAVEQMNYYPVSPGINDPGVNLPSMIIPTSPADQFGNLTLFD
ncbi:MAG: SOS response-associated peptidase [Chryseolinea sp.]